MNEHLLIGILHLSVRHGSVAENRASLLRHVEEAAAQGARIILAPELALSGYSFESIDDVTPFTEEVTGETLAALSEAARRLGVYLCTGFAERDSRTGILYNSAVVFGPDGTMKAHHRKHVAERRWSCPGQPTPTSIFETSWGKIGVLICADTYYGLLPRSFALRGADLILVCANWPPTGIDPREVWRARALENGIGIIAANRTGIDKVMDCRTAPSYAVMPEGTVLVDHTSDESRFFLVEYPLERHCFPRRLREEMTALRRPQNYNAIALDASGLEDFPGMWGLPPAGPIEIRCLVPQVDIPSLEEIVRTPWDVPRLIVLPPSVDGLPMKEVIRQSKEDYFAVAGWTLAGGGRRLPALIHEGQVTSLDPGLGSVTVNFGPARIALVQSEALRHPETAVALSKQGCDIVVAQADSLSEDIRLILGIKSLERLAVAVAAPDGATICGPPDGHERWHETKLYEPGICAAVINTAKTRKKRFLDRVDLEALLCR